MDDLRVKQESLLSRIEDITRIANEAAHEAQAENRRLGIPNWYGASGILFSDTGEVEILDKKAKF